MKTLKSQMFHVSGILLCVLVTLVGIVINRAFEEKKLVKEYEIKNQIAGHLNAATGWQAVERGLGATILGSGEGDSSPLFSKFMEMAQTGDTEVLHAKNWAKNWLAITKNKHFEEKLNQWQETYQALKIARPRIARGDISKDKWLDIATANIRYEFNLRNLAFIPQNQQEQIPYLNSVLRPHITKLREFAGLERALVANTIARRGPFSHETMNRIKHYRSIVEQSVAQVLLLKGQPSTSKEMKQAIMRFEKEFLHSFQLLRENVFVASHIQEAAIRRASIQLIEKKAALEDYLAGISHNLLNMSRHQSVTGLAKALVEKADLSERLTVVETLFDNFSKINQKLYQIRYLDNTGQERVRVDSDGRLTTIVRGKQLQNKRHRYYFQNAINLQPGEVYLSHIDLNMELKEVETPSKPTLRFVTPVFIDGKTPAGMIIFNLLVNTPLFLHKLIEESEEAGNYLLVHHDGFYIHHPDEAKEWGMMEKLNRSHHNIKQDSPQVAEQILSGKAGTVRVSAKESFVYQPIFIQANTNHFFVMIKTIKNVAYPVDAATWFEAATKAIDAALPISKVAGTQANTVMLEMKSAAKRNLIVSVCFFIFVVFIFYLFTLWAKNNILRPIHKLIDITQQVATGDFSQRVAIRSEDEIGQLGLAFNQMAEDLQRSTHQQLEAKEQAEEAKEQAEIANKAKSVFLANMSHELRSPLNAILGFTQIMTRSQTLSQEHIENIGIISRSGEHLLTLINQVLDLSKIEAGQTNLNENNFDLYRLLDDVKEMFQPKADEKHLQFCFEREPEVPQYVRTDEVKLRQVLINLLNNALKFTEVGGICVRIGIRKDQAQLQFEVEDTGLGIAPEELDSLFKAFVQTQSGQQVQEGTGLGLAISHQFVQLMGGDIQVESEVGCGTLFKFDIQVNIVEASQVTCSTKLQRRVIALEPGQPRYRILIVDDKWTNRQFLIKMLNPLGFELQEATNGQEAIEIGKEFEPQLIYMDMRMPVMSGYEATKRIKATVKGQATAIIALTASSLEEERAVALSAGCDDFMRKPFKEGEIFEMISKHIGVRYVYEEPEAITNQTQAEPLTPDALAVLPANWIAHLHDAAERADADVIFERLEQIKPEHTQLAEAIAALAKDFQFDELIALTNGVQTLAGVQTLVWQKSKL